MRDSHDEQMPDRSILVARWVWALGADADSGLLQLSAVSEGFESGLVVSDGRGVPRRGGAGRLRIRRDGAQHRQRRVIGHGPTVREQPRPDPLDIRTGPVVASAAHPCGRRSMHARSAARYAIGPQLAFGRSGFRAPAFHVEPGRPRCSGLEDAAWALGAWGAQRRATSITGTAPNIRSSKLPWVAPVASTELDRSTPRAPVACLSQIALNTQQ